jgi:6-phosphogluconolactonase
MMRATVLAAALSMLSAAHGLAATFVYVSNAEDGDIAAYTLQGDGSLKPRERYKAEKLVMPMAVSPDKRFLIAAVRSKPYRALTYSIDPSSGALKAACSGPLAESFPTYRSIAAGGFSSARPTARTSSA